MYVRPTELIGKTYYRDSGCCHLYITVNWDKKDVREVFAQSNSGGCTALLSSLCRVISIALQNGVSKEEIAKTLSRVKCPSCVNKHCDGLSCGDIIGKCLLEPR